MEIPTMVRHKREPGIFEAIRITDELLKSQLFRTILAPKGWWALVHQTTNGAQLVMVKPEDFDELYEPAIKSEFSIFEHCQYLVGLLRPDLRDGDFEQAANAVLDSVTALTSDDRILSNTSVAYERQRRETILANTPTEKMIDLALDRILKSNHMGVMHQDEVNKRRVMVQVLTAIGLAKHIRTTNDAGVLSDVEKITIVLRHDLNSADIQMMPNVIERLKTLLAEWRKEAEDAKDSAAHNGSYQGGLAADDRLEIIKSIEEVIA